MKAKTLDLRFEKSVISKLQANSIKGGSISTGSCICGTSTCPTKPSGRPSCGDQ